MSATPNLSSAAEHRRQQAALVASGVVAARTAQRDTLDRLVALILALRLVLFRRGAAAVPAMLAEQGIDADPVAEPGFGPMVDVASDGRPMRSLLELARTDPGVDLDRVVATQLQDAGRAGESLAVAARPAVTTYTRMLQLPSCGRCVILAGRAYRWSTGFQRHPLCDCIHIPTTEAAAGDVRTDPVAAIRSMTEVEQSKALTVAGARAVRDGADPAQVVNARRGMSTAQVAGRALAVTSEGTTRRGAARKAMGGRPVRLMPESIYELAEGDRAEAIRLLRLYGYLD